MSWLKRLIRSVFTKLLVVIILTGICVNIVVGTFFWIHRSGAGRPLHKNIAQYLNYIIDDLGIPPSLERAKELAKQASLQITYESPTLSWSTVDDISDVHKAHWRDWGQNPQMRFGRYRGHHFVALNHEDGRFVFAIDKSTVPSRFVSVDREASTTFPSALTARLTTCFPMSRSTAWSVRSGRTSRTISLCQSTPIRWWTAIIV